MAEKEISLTQLLVSALAAFRDFDAAMADSGADLNKRRNFHG